MASSKSDDYQKGSQPVAEQQATYDLFMNLAKWSSLYIGAVILFFTLWLQPGGNLFFGLFCTVALLVIGHLALRAPKKH